MRRFVEIITLFIIISISILYGFETAIVSNADNSRTSFNKGWLFSRYGSMPDGSMKEEPAGLEKRNCADSLWRKLDLPHDWGIEGPFRMDLPSSTGKLPWAGIGWYRKHFNLSQEDKGKHFFIDFDGAMSYAQVWLNGKYIGQWPYGYASFRFELTPYIYFDRENVLAVRLDNPPNSSRWYPGGGIYRNVWFVKTDPVHIAHWGTFVTTPRITKDQATVHIQNEIENQSAISAKITLVMKINEYGKKEIIGSSRETNVQISAGRTEKSGTEIVIQNPKLWNPESPNLYQAKTYIQQNRRIVDSTSTVFGIRTVQFTPDNGFVLNGKRVQIKGVCNHHDLGLLGTAVNEKALKRQIKLLQEMGCNAIRTSHNPPAPELLSLCDQMGMLVLDEAFDCWERGKTPNDYSRLFKEWHEKDIRAYVWRDRNHPCVIAWSSGNEIREQGDGILAQKLKDIFNSEDSTRPVTAACNKPEAGFDGFQHSVDIFGYNYKPHLYEKFHEVNPSKPLYGSETASCVSTFGEYFFPVSDDKLKGLFDNQVSSYDLSAPFWANIPDVEFEGQDKNPFVAGEFVWTGFDYLGEPTPYGADSSISRSSYFGIFDLCGFKKDRFYLYQARWRPDFPMAHILPHWNWPDRIGKVAPVHVYTSGDEAELFLNGKSLGRKKKEQFQYRLRWDDVEYATGELKVIAYKNGKRWAMDIMKTTSPVARLELTVDCSTIDADGRDLAFVTVKTVDKDGLRVPTADNLISFKVSGPGVIAAVGNGDPTNHNSFQSEQYKVFHGQCMLIIRSIEGKSGPIQVTAELEALENRDILIMSK
ncbi:MAG: beta-galactosidase GalB [Bacteroidota bacterium]